MRFSKYFEIARVSFRESVVYRLDAATSLASSILFLILYYYVWSAIAASGQLNSSLNQIITYFIVGQVVGKSVFVNVETFIGEKVRKGTVVNELKRPITLFSQAYFHEVGKISFNFLAKSLPIAFLGFMFVETSFPSVANTLLFLLSIFLAFNLVFLFSYITSMLIFWTKIEWSIRGTRNHVQKILSGSLFPLFLLPDYLKPIFGILPFQAMIDGPIRIFMQKGTVQNSLAILGNQLAWIVIMFVLAHFSWKKASKKLTVQGG